ncbi:hypothetical protein, partial [Massilia sp. CCM 8734]|uniref:hypothetical protein n=1 Tax=Massilia sp. CCM 8734 TaxID=2609283 RepID=UPI001420B963
MSITNREYYGTFHKYYIVGCAVQDRTTYGFVLDRLYSDQEVEDEEREGHDSTLRPKRLVVYYSDEEIDDQWGAISLDGWSYTYEPLAKRREATLTSRNGRLDEHFFKDSGQPDGLGKGYSFISV